MDYESEVVKFLSQKENLPFALEIAEKIVVVKEKLQKDFWKSVERASTAHVPGRSLVKGRLR